MSHTLLGLLEADQLVLADVAALAHSGALETDAALRHIAWMVG